MNKEKIVEVCRHFGVNSKITYIEQKKSGLINITYYLETLDEKKYVLQRINTYVFKNPEELMQNISSVTHFVRKKIRESGGDPERETLRFLPCETGKFYYIDEENSAWRLYYFVDESYTIDETKDLEVFKSAGATFGKFMRYLNTYPAKELNETIVDFHNTPVRFQTFLNSLEKNASGRKDKCEKEIRFVLDREADTHRIVDLCENGQIPIRVTHNDSKINNVLFDCNTDKGICVIDLDTVMPGVSLYDFGDSLRSGANNTREDDANLDNVFFDLDLFRSYAEGFLSETADCLTKAEKENLPFGVKLMTFECGIRFLTDYLDGDLYFRTDYAEHNIVRARNQFKLVEDIEAKYDEMQKIVRECLEKYE